jgi:hypothetical protein
LGDSIAHVDPRKLVKPSEPPKPAGSLCLFCDSLFDAMLTYVSFEQKPVGVGFLVGRTNEKGEIIEI